MSIIFESSEGRVLADGGVASGRRRLVIELASGDDPMCCYTRYPDELIQAVLAVRPLTWLCDELARDKDPLYVERYLRYAMLGYVDEGQFVGKRLLDFGCGAGASTMVLCRMLPHTEIVGVELVEEDLAVAKARARFYGAESTRFVVSPGPEQLPPGIGLFDFVSFSAVFEHLLPNVRSSWSKCGRFSVRRASSSSTSCRTAGSRSSFTPLGFRSSTTCRGALHYKLPGDSRSE